MRQYQAVKPSLVDGFVVRTGEIKDEPWEGFSASIANRRRMLPHMETGTFPAHLFERRAPNQTEGELRWMRDNFRHTTLPVFLDLDNTVGRGLHERNWSISIDDDAARAYVLGGVREWGALFEFVKHALLRPKISDPMAVLAFLPSSIETVTDAEGVERIAPDARLYAEPMIYSSDRVWGYEYDGWYLLRLAECSTITHGTQKKKNGVVCVLIDGENVWRIEQTGRSKDDTFDISLSFSHGVGQAPCIHLMGVPSLSENGLVWTSPFMAVSDLLDEALLEEHQLIASKAKLMFPHAVVVGDPCSFYDRSLGAQCIGGSLAWMEGDKQMSRTCPECHGTGHKNRMSPFGELVINTNPNSTAPDGANATNAMAFVSPQTDPSRFVREEIDRYIKEARGIMHLDAEVPMVSGSAPTATQAGLNAKAREAFVRPICDQMFTIFSFGVQCLGRYLNGPTWDGYTLTKPTSYDLRTDAEYMAMLSEVAASPLPPVFTSMLVAQYMDYRYGGEAHKRSALEALLMADRLIGMSQEAIASDVAAGRIAPWETLIHYSGAAILGTLESDDAFRSMDTLQRVAAIKAAAQASAQQRDGTSSALDRLNAALQP